MQITSVSIAPSYETLRPLRHRTITSAFPVYPNLSETMLMAAHPDPTVAHVMAVCAGYAYSDTDTVATMMARLGLDQNRCLMVAESVDAMFICSTAYIVQSADRRVVTVCYRGTEPANLVNWLTDADVNPAWMPFGLPSEVGDAAAEQTAGATAVHAGFYRNVRATRYAVIGVLQRALAGRSIDVDDESVGSPMEALYLTGHSLGAAMAALMAIMIKTNSDYRQLAGLLKGVYTFGQPMIGAPEFARRCDQTGSDGTPALAEGIFRYVYAHDVVAQLPPRETGPFAHFGQEFGCDELPSNPDKARPNWSARPSTRQTSVLGMSIGAAALFTRQFIRLRNLPLHQSIVDHGPQNYIAALTPDGVTSEFGG
jgi:hypothetical protein